MYLFFLCVCMCAKSSMVHVEVRGQPTGVSPDFHHVASRDSSTQVWQQAPLPSDPSCSSSSHINFEKRNRYVLGDG